MSEKFSVGQWVKKSKGYKFVGRVNGTFDYFSRPEGTPPMVNVQHVDGWVMHFRENELEAAAEPVNHAETLAVALEAAQFGFDHRRCPVCAGWNVGPNGETDNAHTADCIVGRSIKAYRKEFPKP